MHAVHVKQYKALNHYYYIIAFNLVIIRACCKSSAMLMGILHFGKIKIRFWKNFVMDRVHKLCNLELDKTRKLEGQF